MKTTSHQQKIYKEQDALLIDFGKIKPSPYVLSGGTALSRFYFHHRFSEDLDFFCKETHYSFEKVEKIVNLLRRSGWTCKLIGRADNPSFLKATSYVISKNHPVKVDFLEDPFTGMWKPLQKRTESGVLFRVDSLDQIYYRKFFSILEHGIASKK